MVKSVRISGLGLKAKAEVFAQRLGSTDFRSSQLMDGCRAGKPDTTSILSEHIVRKAVPTLLGPSTG